MSRRNRKKKKEISVIVHQPNQKLFWVIASIAVTIAIFAVSLAFDLNQERRALALDLKRKGETKEIIIAGIEEANNLYAAKSFKEALDKCKEINKILSSEEYPDLFAEMMSCQGRIHTGMSQIDNSESNLFAAIGEFHKSLSHIDKAKMPMVYGRTMMELGDAYVLLSPFQSEEINLNRAINIYREAYRYCAADEMAVARIKTNTGKAYLDLSYLRNKKQNLLLAVENYEEAKRIVTVYYSNPNYGLIESGLAGAYLELSLLENEAELTKKAMRSFRIALSRLDPKSNRTEYARLLNNYGIAIGRTRKKEEKYPDYERAIEQLEESVKISSPDASVDYIDTQMNIGSIYRFLSEIEDKKKNLEKSIAIYKDILTSKSLTPYSHEYGRIQHNLGVSYYQLSSVCDREINLSLAINALIIAQRIKSPDVWNLDFASSQKILGYCYRDMAGIRDRADNLRKALASLLNADRVYSNEDQKMHEQITKEIKEIDRLLKQ